MYFIYNKKSYEIFYILHKNFETEKTIIKNLLKTHSNLRYYDRDCLKDITLYHKKYVNHTEEEWVHERCQGCSSRISERKGDLHKGYCTEDEESWICEKCYNKFKETFNWTSVEKMN